MREANPEREMPTETENFQELLPRKREGQHTKLDLGLHSTTPPWRRNG